MAYRRIIIAVDCASDAEVANVQAAVNRMNNVFRVRGSDVLAISPLVEKNGDVIAAVMRSVAQDGLKGLASAVPYLIKNLRR